MSSSVNAAVGVPDLAAIQQAVRAVEPYLLDTLSAFVGCPSLSGQEGQAAAFFESALADLGLTSQRIYLDSASLSDYPLFSTPCCPDGGRYNVLARHEPRAGQGRSVLFNGHLDVVPTGPADMWTRPPFEAYVQDGWLYGRGAGDMKGGLVCALAAFKALRTLGLQPAGAVGFNAVLEEECTGNGTLATVSALKRAIGQAELTAFDAVVIPEPVSESLLTAELGVYWMYVDIAGRPAHAGYMTTGKNPIEAAQEVVAGLKKLEAEWNLPENRPPEYRDSKHPINFNLGQIHAGEWNSSVPCSARLGLRIGLYPTLDVDGVIRQVEDNMRATLAALGGGLAMTVHYEGFKSPGCVYDLDSPAMQALADAHQAVVGEPPRRIAHPAVTDGRYFRLMTDMPVTCYGPVARDIHGIDESVSIASMLTVTATMVQYLVQWCGVEPYAGA
ncbi:ArgE/DapE family deacylase [Bordetella sp. N]|uniref:ArgE/DapE family deacylase n=1 Tax=Bordetella sp. N TaxID=1746199 RepID=UPI000708EBAA|nr:ArgE/DapE family deacylase [Bordetella sp. N]ALM86472.1 acetylornithine deacetylase [Bordetella sp. N]